MDRRRFAVVGAFLLGGLLLFAAGLFLIGDRRMLFQEQFELNTTFGKVTGLQIGSKVRMAGLDAGEVLEITIPSRPSDSFRVRMRLREDVHQLVRTDSVSAIQTDGIVGNSFIQISRGTDESPIVEPGGTIAGNDPIEFADLIQEGRDTFRTVTREVLEVKEDLTVTIRSINEISQNANTVLTDFNRDLNRITASAAVAVDDAQHVITDTRGMVADLRAGKGTVGQILTDDALYRRLTGIGNEAELTVRNLREATDRGRQMIESFTASDGTAQQLATVMRDTVVQAREVVSDLTESSEALKRNFLFRGFFRQRGFYDLDAISREAYLGGALEGKDKTALRVWIEAYALFETVDGREVLTEEGRRRLDSVMADFVRYPRDSPLVVEGYAESEAGEAAYLLSSDRALLVREYLINRFRRKATLVDSIGLSNQADGSPRGDGRWSGVALTLFVRNDALTAGSAVRR